MDNKKIGAFITERRKIQNLTQQELADKLCVTVQAISKWERGIGLPDVSLFKPLCEALNITVNELLCGETIPQNEKAAKAENQIIDLLREKKQENKKKIWLSTIVCIVGACVMLPAILLAGFAVTDLTIRICLVIGGAIVFVVLLIVAIVIYQEVGFYECGKCHKTFVPDMKSFVKGIHKFTHRKLKCPHCNEVSWCKHKLNK